MQGARRVVSAGPPACGWLRGTSRTSPEPPRRWRRPVRLRSTSARGCGFAAYLSACGGQPLQRPRCGLRQGGASLTTFGFVTTVPRYLPEASNSLTFVRGADRAYCAPRKWLWRPTFALQKLAAARPPEGHWRAHPAAAPCRRTRQRYLAARRTYCAPCKRFCRPTDAQPVLAARTPPGGALACVPGSGALPPAPCCCCFGKKFVRRYRTYGICRGVWREVPESSRRTNNKNMFARRLAEQ